MNLILIIKALEFLLVLIFNLLDVLFLKVFHLIVDINYCFINEYISKIIVEPIR